MYFMPGISQNVSVWPACANFFDSLLLLLDTNEKDKLFALILL